MKNVRIQDDGHKRKYTPYESITHSTEMPQQMISIAPVAMFTGVMHHLAALTVSFVSSDTTKAEIKDRLRKELFPIMEKMYMCTEAISGHISNRMMPVGMVLMDVSCDSERKVIRDFAAKSKKRTHLILPIGMPVVIIQTRPVRGKVRNGTVSTLVGVKIVSWATWSALDDAGVSIKANMERHLSDNLGFEAGYDQETGEIFRKPILNATRNSLVA